MFSNSIKHLKIYLHDFVVDVMYTIFTRKKVKTLQIATGFSRISFKFSHFLSRMLMIS